MRSIQIPQNDFGTAIESNKLVGVPSVHRADFSGGGWGEWIFSQKYRRTQPVKDVDGENRMRLY